MTHQELLGFKTSVFTSPYCPSGLGETCNLESQKCRITHPNDSDSGCAVFEETPPNWHRISFWFPFRAFQAIQKGYRASKKKRATHENAGGCLKVDASTVAQPQLQSPPWYLDQDHHPLNPRLGGGGGQKCKLHFWGSISLIFGPVKRAQTLIANPEANSPPDYGQYPQI